MLYDELFIIFNDMASALLFYDRMNKANALLLCKDFLFDRDKIVESNYLNS